MLGASVDTWGIRWILGASSGYLAHPRMLGASKLPSIIFNAGREFIWILGASMDAWRIHWILGASGDTWRIGSRQRQNVPFN